MSFIAAAVLLVKTSSHIRDIDSQVLEGVVYSVTSANGEDLYVAHGPRGLNSPTSAAKYCLYCLLVG